MWFLWMLSWISTALQIGFVTLAIAAGLYYLAELVEEYTVITAKIIKTLTSVTFVIYVCLFLFESFPTGLVVCGIVSQVLHFILLHSFPFFTVASPQFLAAVVMVVVNHYLAFRFFGEFYYPFSEVMAYFTLCLWMVPFAFFVSLSANENVLPTVSETRHLLPDDNDVVSNYFMRREKKRGLLAAFQGIKDSFLPTRGKKSF